MELTMAEHQVMMLEKAADALNRKIAILRNLDTKSIIEKLPELENSLHKLLLTDLDSRREYSPYIAGFGSDCSAVKQFIAGLDPPGDGKKLTVAEREAWILRQREENEALKAEIATQTDVYFENEESKVAIETARRRLDSHLAVLRLKTAQLEFLAGR